MEMPLHKMIKDPSATTDFAKNTVVFRATASASFRAVCPCGCSGSTLVLVAWNQERLSPQGLSLMLSAITSAHLEDPWQPASLPSTHPPSPGYRVVSFQYTSETNPVSKPIYLASSHVQILSRLISSTLKATLSGNQKFNHFKVLVLLVGQEQVLIL